MSNADQLFQLVPEQPRHQAALDAARVLLFNCQHASPGRARRQAAWIGSQEGADLVVLTEVGSGPGGAALIEALADNGYATVIAPRPQVPDYFTVLASRSAPMQAVPSGITVLPHRAPAAIVHIGGRPLGLVGLYVPSRGPRERRNEAKKDFQEAVTAALPDLMAIFPDMPVIVAGDLNVVEPGHQPPHAVFGRWEYAFYDSFKSAGLTDAFRHQHPETADHSWYGRSGRGFRFDHIFTTAEDASRITNCVYDYRPLEAKLTDHAAMGLQLSVSATQKPGIRLPQSDKDADAPH